MNLQNRKKIWFGIIVLIFVVFTGLIILQEREEDIPVQATSSLDAATQAAVKSAASSETPVPEITPNPEESIVTYFQGPKAWEKRKAYSGSWGRLFVDGGSFGGFGCGLCCMANIYSTLTKYQCSPLDMYEYAKKVSGYGGGGAIPWECMLTTLEYTGFTCRLEEKPVAYKEFQEMIKRSESTIALVSSYNDDSYWEDTPGHYVTLFLYDEKEDTIFLGDSGDLKRNRSRIPLKTVYKALKMSSPKQLLLVNKYDEKRNEWKANRMTGRWVKLK